MKKTLSVVLVGLVLMGVGGYAALRVFGGRSDSQGFFSLPKPVVDEKVTLTVLHSRALTFLVMRETTTQIVVEHKESNWAGDWEGVLWANVKLTHGVDLQDVTPKDLRRDGSTICVRLPEPKALSVSVDMASIGHMTKSTALPWLQAAFDNGRQLRALERDIDKRAREFAVENHICPTREEMVRQLNDATPAIKAATGMDLKFE